MPLGEVEIARLDALLAALGDHASVAALEAALPRVIPGLGCRFCDAGDVLEEPFRSTPAADLHLLDASRHCIRVTDIPAEATALLIAGKVTA